MKIMTYLRKDWPIIPIAVFLMAGYFWPVYELTYLQKQEVEPLWRVIGVILMMLGGFIEISVRIQLRNKAKFPNLQSTKLLQIVKGHRLLTDGMFSYVRHPLYLGRILLSVGWVLIFLSFYGAVFMAIGILFFLPRIRIEEDMLLKEFGEAYRAYQKRTKKLIPYLF